MSEEQKAGWLGMSLIEIALLATLVLGAASVGARLFLGTVETHRLEVSLQKVRELDWALEAAAMRSGSLPCMRSAADLPRDVIRTVPADGLLDGWENPIRVVGSRRRFILTATSAGIVEGSRWVPVSGGRRSEVVVSNGEVLRLPVRDYDGTTSLEPRMADALAEAQPCGDPGDANAWRPPEFIPRAGAKYLGQYYVYLFTEGDARGVARDLAAQEFTTEVRRAAGSTEWLCAARKVLVGGRSLAPDVWRVAKAHRCVGCTP